MQRRRIAKEEREKILPTNEADDFWEVYTFNTDLKKRLRKYAAQHPDYCSLKTEDKEWGSVTYIVKKGRLSIRLTAPYSEARRKVAHVCAKRHGFYSDSKKIQ